MTTITAQRVSTVPRSHRAPVAAYVSVAASAAFLLILAALHLLKSDLIVVACAMPQLGYGASLCSCAGRPERVDHTPGAAATTARPPAPGRFRQLQRSVPPGRWRASPTARLAA